MTEQTIKRIRKFISDRDQEQLYSLTNLENSISIKENELLECFKWGEKNFELSHMK